MTTSVPLAVDAGRTTTSFRTFLKAAGTLAIARQLGALVFAGAVLALPLWTSHAWVTDFVWAYFAMLTLTSFLGLGFERLAATVVSEREGPGSAGFGSLILVRLATIPAIAFALWLMMAFVGVSLSLGASLATLLWIAAALLSILAFGGLRAQKNARVEPSLLVGARIAQAAVLCAVATTGGSVAVAVLGVALVEFVAAGIALRALGAVAREPGSLRGILSLPWRRGVAFAGIEVVSLAYLRADLLLVGRMLGAGVGATYGMIYRVLDALTTAVGSVGLWLFAEGVTDTDEKGAAEHLRERSLVLVPRLAFVVAIGALLVSELAAHLLDLSSEATITLQLLVAAFPLLTVNSIELHVRSGTGRNREVLHTGTVAVLVNVGACLVLISLLGLVGAALALLLSETVQSLLLLVASTPTERARVGRSLWLGIACGRLLVALGRSVHAGMLPVAGLLVVVSIGIVVAPFVHRRQAAVLQ